MKKLLLLMLLFPGFLSAAEENDKSLEEFDDYEIVNQDSNETEENRAFTIQNNTDETIEISFKPNESVPSLFVEPNEKKIIGFNDQKYNLIYMAYFSQIKQFWARPKDTNVRSSSLVKIISGKNYIVDLGDNNQLIVTK